MSLNHFVGRIAGAFSICLALATISFAQPSSPPIPPSQPVSPAEIEQCRQAALSYCQAWKAAKFDSMYVYLTSEGMGKIDKDKFTRQYAEYNEWGCKLGSFSIVEAYANSDKEVIVKINMAFVKEIKPTMVNGGNNFHLAKDGGVWKIFTVVPPIVPPQTGGSGGHPGE